MYCRYCVLQAYFDRSHQVVYDNFNDLETEVIRKMATWRGVVRFGTGEFGDSLYLDHLTAFSEKVSALLAPYPNAIVEFKTKSTNIKRLSAIKNRSQVIIGFSMNTPNMISLLEEETASLEERLAAATECEALGFRVAFHFDPMVYSNEWEREYPQVVDRIYEAIKDPNSIAWISMGGFRCVPELKKRLLTQNKHLPLFCGEMILGDDRKLRYFRPIRESFYKVMQERIMSRDRNATLYMCMESPEVWEASGMAWRIPKGLVKYLDLRAEELLHWKN